MDFPLEFESVIDPEAADPEDEIVIDPEAADPVELLHNEPVKEVDTTRAQRKTRERMKHTALLEEFSAGVANWNVNRASMRQEKAEEEWRNKKYAERDKKRSLSNPGLQVVVGSWWDSKGSFYEVSFAETPAAKKSDHEATTLNVLTTRPTGAVRWTSGLIKLVRNGWYEPAADICWGDGRSQINYVVELPLQSWDKLRWLPSRGGSKASFEWTRYKEQAADTASRVQQDKFGDQWQSRRSTNIRRVQGRSGAWRVIDKEVIYE